MTIHRNRDSAFTLIELMVVIAIAILVMGWSVPNMLSAIEKQGVNKAVTDLMEGCKQARALAILTGQPAELVIRADDGHMTIRPSSGPRLMRESGAAFGPQGPDFSQEVAPSPRSRKSRTAKLKSFNEALADDVAIELLDVNFIDQMQFTEAIVRFFPNGTSDEFTIVIRVDDNWRKVGLDPITAIANVDDLKDYR